MSLLNRYIFKEHIYPFATALIVLLFVLLTNFLLRSLDKFLGKGLELLLIIEYVFLNLAWILALAVPMAVLVSTLMAFGRLSSDNEIVALKSLSVSYIKLLIPSLLFGISITIFMMYFNNQILPEMNHKARILSSDISRKRPDLNFEIGYFMQGIPNYTFLIGDKDKNEFKDITIFNNNKKIKRTILASKGKIATLNDGVILFLSDGSIHEYMENKNEEYRVIHFKKYNVVIPIDNLKLNRKNSGIRGDREMTYHMMKQKIISYNKKINDTQIRIQNRLINEAKKYNIKSIIDSSYKITDFIANKAIEKINETMNNTRNDEKPDIFSDRLQKRMKNLKKGIDNDFSLINSYKNSINKYLVELHKKFSIPFASIIFVLIGAPLGMMARKSGFAVSMGLSIGFFIIYWIFLISGEEFADRGLLAPAISMWLPNIVMGAFGILLCYFHSQEKSFYNINIFKRKS